MVSGVEPTQFTAELSVDLIAKGISGFLRDGKGRRSVIEVLRKVDELGVPPLKLFDGSAMELLVKECRRILKCGEVEEFVELMEILAGNFSHIFRNYYFASLIYDLNPLMLLYYSNIWL